MNTHLLGVWISIAGQYIKAGEIVCEITSNNGNAQGAFRYTKEYLALPDAYALDPVSLPLDEQTYSIGHPGVFGVFQDSLPDDWGKRLLIRKHQIPRSAQSIPGLLLALGSCGLGALAYTEDKKTLISVPEISSLNLERLAIEAQLFEAGTSADAEIRHLLSAGSSPGGARPKALVYDAETETHFIAKFPSIKDNVDVVRIEAATMSLAAKAGLNVPPSRLVECGGKPVFLVERFDVTKAGRRHMCSMQTLLKAGGFYQCQYKELLDVVRRVSADPIVDSSQLFRQMVFNAVVGNTDDHLKNFWMVCDTYSGWRLSPAFDLVPDISQSSEHVLFFDLSGYYPGREKLERLGKTWRIPNVATITEEVFSAMESWREEFLLYGITETDCQRFVEIDRHIIGNI